MATTATVATTTMAGARLPVLDAAGCCTPLVRRPLEPAAAEALATVLRAIASRPGCGCCRWSPRTRGARRACAT